MFIKTSENLVKTPKSCGPSRGTSIKLEFRDCAGVADAGIIRFASAAQEVFETAQVPLPVSLLPAAVPTAQTGTDKIGALAQGLEHSGVETKVNSNFYISISNVIVLELI